LSFGCYIFYYCLCSLFIYICHNNFSDSNS
jgi:hypothetical protein